MAEKMNKMSAHLNKTTEKERNIIYSNVYRIEAQANAWNIRDKHTFVGLQIMRTKEHTNEAINA